MDNIEYDAAGNLEKLYSQDSLLDILMDIDNTLDSMDIYAFKNWIYGEIVSGPELEKYWVTIILKYDYKEMPDPQGGARLLKHGAKIKYMLTSEESTVSLSDYDETDKQDAYINDPETGEVKRKTVTDQIWLVELKMPKRFIDDVEKGIVSINDEETADEMLASEAENEGLNDEAALENNQFDEFGNTEEQANEPF